jgi:hypothetical protein
MKKQAGTPRFASGLTPSPNRRASGYGLRLRPNFPSGTLDTLGTIGETAV